MPQVVRRKYRDPATGEVKTYRKWYAKITSADGRKRWEPLSTNKAAAEAMLRKLLDRIEREKAGLTDPYEQHRRRPLVNLLADWEALLRAGDAGEKHVRNTVRAVRRVFDGCGFMFFSDIIASTVQSHMSELKGSAPAVAVAPEKDWYTKAELAALLGVKPCAVPPLVKRHRLAASGNGKARRYPKATAEALVGTRGTGKGTKTVNMYLAAVKQFCSWMVLDRRAPENPLAHLSGGNPDHDRRTEFATLTADEIARLVAAARTSAATFRGLSGMDRAALYLTATYTAFRPVELSRLTPADFLLSGPVPLVRLDGTRTKNGKTAEQPLPTDVANELRHYLSARPSDGPVWSGTWAGKAADLLRVDLPTAGVPFTKSGPDGRVLVVSFYSLRHSAGLLAEQGGATLREVMTLMRHSDPKLTLKTYGRLRLDERGATVEKMPSVLTQKSVGVTPHVTPCAPGCDPTGDSDRGRSRTGEDSTAPGDDSQPLEIVEVEDDRERSEMVEEGSPGRIRTYDPPVNSSRTHGGNPTISGTFSDSAHGVTPCVPPSPVLTSDLARIVERWPTLPDHIKAAMLALVGTAPASPPPDPKRLDDTLPPGFEKPRTDPEGG